jgi:hypothetical protein
MVGARSSIFSTLEMMVVDPLSFIVCIYECTLLFGRVMPRYPQNPADQQQNKQQQPTPLDHFFFLNKLAFVLL